MRVVLALALLGSLLAGCTELGTAEGPALASAQQAITAADRAAFKWDAQAELLSATALEMDDKARQEARAEWDEEREDIRQAREDDELTQEEYENLTAFFGTFERILETPDAAPGDGRASVWYFVYINGDEDALYAIAVSRGEILFAQEDGEAAEEFAGDGFFGMVGEWRIDSDDAAQAGQLGNSDYATLCATANVMTFTTLMQGENGPVWFIGAERQAEGSGPDEAFFAVDATTGSLVQDEVIGPLEDFLFQESGVEEGAFTGAVQASTTIQFEIEDERHASMAVHLAVSPAPLQPVQVTVTDPRGTKTSFTVAAGEAPFFAQGSALLSSPPGLYTAMIQVPLAVTLSYELSWCTDGLPTSTGEFQPRACALMPNPLDDDGETLSRLGSWVLPW